jgi:hypothetical protein
MKEDKVMEKISNKMNSEEKYKCLKASRDRKLYKMLDSLNDAHL